MTFATLRRGESLRLNLGLCKYQPYYLNFG
ncbi:hypothetical protein VPHK45_0016 [Vibrio phage K45]